MLSLLKKKYSHRNLLNLLRAYRKVIHTEGEKEIFSIINALPLIQEKRGLYSRVITQKLLAYYLKEVSCAVLLSRGQSNFRCILAIPFSWRKHLTSKGVLISRRSFFAWLCRVLLSLKRGVITFLSLVRKNINLTLPKAPSLSYALLCNLPKNAATIGEDNFLEWFFRRKTYKNVWAHVPETEKVSEYDSLLLANEQFPRFRNKRQLMRFSARSFGFLLMAFMDFILGRWSSLFIFEDKIKLAYVKSLRREDLPSQVVFLNTEFTYRPLWTYWIEKMGGSIDLYFYSLNTVNIRCKEWGAIGVYPGYQLMTWSRYYTWNRYHADFLAALGINDEKIQIVNQFIPLSGSHFPIPVIPAIPKRSIAIFDVPPFRESFMASIGRPCHFYTYSLCRKFLLDIIELCREQDVVPILKCKRFVKKKTSQQYTQLIGRLKLEGDVIMLGPDLSANSLLDKVSASVSMPFTSTAVLGDLKSIPSVYYDADCFIEKNQLAVSGLPLLSGKEELRQWFYTFFGEAVC